MMKQKVCQKCSVSFNCHDSECWCNEFPAIMSLDPLRNCYCPNCLKEAVISKIEAYMNNLTPENISKIMALGKPEKPVEGIDYYINEDGLFVFTSWYHLRRGDCCGNNCKHCPYKKEAL
jgi:hypothetical protein